MEEAKKQMHFLLHKASTMAWGVDADAIAMRVEGLLFQRPMRKRNFSAYVTVEEHRRLRLEITAELLGMDYPLLSYKDLEPTQCRAMAMFMNDMPLDILQEVQSEYKRRSDEVIRKKNFGYEQSEITF